MEPTFLYKARRLDKFILCAVIKISRESRLDKFILYLVIKIIISSVSEFCSKHCLRKNRRLDKIDKLWYNI